MKRVYFLILSCFIVFNSFGQLDWNNDIKMKFDTSNYIHFNLEIKYSIRGTVIADADNQGLMIDSIEVITKNYDVLISRINGKLDIFYVLDGVHNIFLSNDTLTEIQTKQKIILKNPISNSLADNQYFNYIESKLEDLMCFINNKNLDYETPKYLKDTLINGREFSIFTKEIIGNTDFGDFIAADYLPQNYIVKYFVDKLNKEVTKIIKQQTNFSTAYLGYGNYRNEYSISYLNDNKVQEYKDKYNINNKEYKDFLFAKEGEYPDIDNYGEVGIKGSWKDSVFNEWKNQNNVLKKEDLNTIYTNIGNKKVKLKDIKGWILVDSWHSRCGGCFWFMQYLSSKESEFKNRNIKVMSVNNLEKPSDFIREFCKKQNVIMENLYFTKPNKMFCKIYPTVMLISPDKKIVYKNDASSLKIEDLLKDIDKIIENYNKENKR